MKTKVSNNRVVIALCMDKERDERLINYLNSKVNKSDYIRSILNEKLSEEENPNAVQDNFITKTLLEVLNNLSSLTDKLISLSNNNFTYNCSSKNAQPLKLHDDLIKTNDFLPSQVVSPQTTNNENTITENLLNIDNGTLETLKTSDKFFDSILDAIQDFKM